MRHLLADAVTDSTVGRLHSELSSPTIETRLAGSAARQMNAAVCDTTQQMLKMNLCPYIFVWVLRRAQEYLPTGRSDTQMHTMDCCAMLLGLCGSAQKLNPAKYHCLVTSLSQHIAPEVLDRACALVARDIRRYTPPISYWRLHILYCLRWEPTKHSRDTNVYIAIGLLLIIFHISETNPFIMYGPIYFVFEAYEL